MAALTKDERRAELAFRALLVYQQYTDTQAEEVETAAVDLMADLLHLLDLQYGVTAEDAHAMAWEHFIAEKEGEDDESREGGRG